MATGASRPDGGLAWGWLRWIAAVPCRGLPPSTMRRLALLALLVAGCAGPSPTGGDLVESRRQLTQALTARGWYVEPVAFANELSVGATGTAYHVRQRGGDERTLLVFEALPDDDGAPDDDALDRDLVTLRQQYAGRASVFYRRPGLLVVTFPRGRTELDLRLAQLLGPPVDFTEGDE